MLGVYALYNNMFQALYIQIKFEVFTGHPGDGCFRSHGFNRKGAVDTNSAGSI